VYRVDIFNQVNWTLSVGDTTVQWLLLDTNQNQPWVINQYTIVITRQPLPLLELPFTESQPHKVCALTQVDLLQVSMIYLYGNIFVGL